MTYEECLKFAKQNSINFVDLKFLDFLGILQHFTVPIEELSETSCEEGIGFDGSSIRGWQPINASDMVVIPDLTTAKIDPFIKEKTLSVICNIFDPVTKQPYSRDPRFVAQKAEKYLISTGLGDVSYFGPEAEFFILDDIRFDYTKNSAFHYIDSVEGRWNTAREEKPNLGYKPRYKEGYFPCSPTDSVHQIRDEICLVLKGLGIDVEAHHHEVATAGQCEIDIKYSNLVNMADTLMWFKYVVKNVAKRNNKTATFMPKVVFEDNGSGMHCHISIWKDEKNLFAGNLYGGLSEFALHFIGGLIHHAKSLCAFTNPSTISYKRLVPGFEAPINLAYSTRNRSAAIRIPMYNSSPKARRIEFRPPDSTSNGYLAFSAILMAGLDGVEREIEPGKPLDKDIYSLGPEELKDVKKTPSSLEEALHGLEEDNEYLLKGSVFTEDVIEKWIRYKMENEVRQIDMRPHPYEFALYYDI